MWMETSRAQGSGAGRCRPVRVLLVNPRCPESFWSFRWAVERVLPGKRAVNPPLGLATLAALCPPHWEVTIVDENVETVPLAPEADLIGICGMGVQLGRQRELLAYYRAEGYLVVAGGSHASLCPEDFEGLADSVVCGEAESTWRQLCRDYEAGGMSPLYRETGTVALADSPVPRFDLLKLDLYTTVTLQFSRGCPYRCEFCDIIVMFGRRPRCKRPEQIGRELDELRRLGVRNVFFVDDNLIGDRPAAKALLRFLVDYQRTHDWAFTFGTEASINLAQDRELLELFRGANFEWVFLGIESPDPESLRETRKTQNLREDVLTSVQRIYSYGIDVMAGFIVGFDNDTLDTFETQYRFIQASGIQAAMVGLLRALPKTPLRERLKREGRLLEDEDHSDNTRLGTNIVPKRMEYGAMVDAYRALYRRLLDDRAIADRVRAKLRRMGRPLYRGDRDPRDIATILWRLLVRGLLPGGPRRLYHFMRSMPVLAPRSLPQAILDWVAALAMRDYVRRNLEEGAPHQAARWKQLSDSLARDLATYVRDGKVALSFERLAAQLPTLSLALKDWPDCRFFGRAGASIDRLLRHTSATFTLRIEAFRAHERRHLERLLWRLSRHGDRVTVIVSEGLRGLVHVDSSRFRLALGGPALEP